MWTRWEDSVEMPGFTTHLLKCLFFNHNIFFFIKQLVIFVFVTELGVSHNFVTNFMSDYFTCV